MVVLQRQPRFAVDLDAGQHPGPRAVLADEERDADALVAAFAHVHGQGLPGEACFALGLGDQFTGVGVAAKSLEVGPEVVEGRGDGRC